MKKRSFSLILALLMMLTLVPAFAAQSALFSEFLTTGKLETPKTPYVKVTVDDSGTHGDIIDLWVMVPSVIRQINSAGESWDEAHPGEYDMIYSNALTSRENTHFKYAFHPNYPFIPSFTARL